jgi:type IV secretion system protein VirD4
VSELLGKETIDLNTYGKSAGRNGNYSTNYQLSGRELLTPDEVRMLDNRYALLFIRGEHAVMDDKYDILKHPNLKLTVDGGGQLYRHGTTEHALDWKSVALKEDGDYELLSEEELESLSPS